LTKQIYLFNYKEIISVYEKKYLGDYKKKTKEVRKQKAEAKGIDKREELRRLRKES
jgi:hypothetical protein